MTKHTDPNAQTIENASADDVRAGDHVTWKYTWEDKGATCTHIREGIAHHRGADGNWRTEDGAWITFGDGEGITITIRRPAQELPPEYDGATLVPANGHEGITTTDGQEFARLTFTTKQSIWYGPNLAARPGDWVIQTTATDRLTPGTWKKASE